MLWCHQFTFREVSNKSLGFAWGCCTAVWSYATTGLGSRDVTFTEIPCLLEIDGRISGLATHRQVYESWRKYSIRNIAIRFKAQNHWTNAKDSKWACKIKKHTRVSFGFKVSWVSDLGDTHFRLWGNATPLLAFCLNTIHFATVLACRTFVILTRRFIAVLGPRADIALDIWKRWPLFLHFITVGQREDRVAGPMPMVGRVYLTTPLNAEFGQEVLAHLCASGVRFLFFPFRNFSFLALKQVVIYESMSENEDSSQEHYNPLHHVLCCQFVVNGNYVMCVFAFVKPSAVAFWIKVLRLCSIALTSHPCYDILTSIALTLTLTRELTRAATSSWTAFSCFQVQYSEKRHREWRQCIYSANKSPVYFVESPPTCACTVTLTYPWLGTGFNAIVDGVLLHWRAEQCENA